MRTRFAAWWDALRTSYWFVPGLMTLAATALAVATTTGDHWLGERGRQLALFAGSPDGARAMLSTVAGAMITVAGLTFSVTIVALTVASQQFGPRLLRNFMRDTGNQVVLGTFVSTFVYCILILGAIRSVEEDGFVPSVSVSIGVTLALASLGVLIYFIHHVSSSLHASQLIHAVGIEIDASIDRLFPEELGEQTPAEDPDALPEVAGRDGEPVYAQANGYLQAIDNQGLMEAAIGLDLLIRMERRPGDPIVRGMRIAHVWPTATPKTERMINETLIVGVQRTPVQDLEFSIDQLVELAVRALSPGVNDPFTATTSVDRLTTSLCTLADRDIPSPVRRDEDGRPRVIAKPWTFAGAIDAAFDQIRQYATTSASVTIRLLEALVIIAHRVRREEDFVAVRRHAGMILRGSESLPEPLDREVVHARYAKVLAALEEPRPARHRGHDRE